MTAVIRRALNALRARTLKRRIRYWVGFVIVLLSLCMVMSLYVIEINNTEERVHEELQQVVSLQGEYIDAWMRERISDLHILVNLDASKRLDLMSMTRAMAALRDNTPNYSSIMFFDKDGISRLDVSAQNNDFGSVSDREYFQAALEGKDYVSGVAFSKISGKPFISISSPLRSDAGEFLGVMVGTVKLETLNQAAKNMKFGKTGVMYVVDNNNTIISNAKETPARSNLQTIDSDIVRRAQQGIVSTDAYTNYEGVRVYGAYRWSNDRRWLVIGEVNSSEMLQNTYKILYTQSGIALLVLVLSLAMVMIGTRRIERPLHYLLKGTGIIQDGEYGYQIDREYFRNAPVELQQLCETYNDMSRKLKTTVQLLEHTSFIDQLTEAYNRRYIMNEGSRLLETSLAAGKPCSVIMADIDHFKLINDTYGHVVGDRVIRYFSNLLKVTNSPTGDVIVSRYGGEEFLLLLIGIDAAAAERYAEWVRTTMERSPYREDKLEIAVTASFGTSTYEGEREFGTTILEDLVARADYALYEAKRQGRNRTVAYGGGIVEGDAQPKKS